MALINEEKLLSLLISEKMETLIDSWKGDMPLDSSIGEGVIALEFTIFLVRKYGIEYLENKSLIEEWKEFKKKTKISNYDTDPRLAVIDTFRYFQGFLPKELC